MRSILLVLFTRRRLLGRRRIETFTLLICLLLCSLSVSCFPHPTTRRTRTTVGSDFGSKIELDFIQIGSTTRLEVVEKLLATDTGVRDERLFWARWATSTWGIFVGGGYSGESFRAWKGRNAMIEFDEKGFVKSYRVVPEKSVVKELTSWVAREASSEFPTPVVITVLHRHASNGSYNSSKLTLTEEFFGFQEPKDGSHNFRIAREKVKRVSKATRGDPDPEYFVSSIHLREKTKAGRKITVRISIPSLFVLLKYLRAEKFVEQDPRLAPNLHNLAGLYDEQGKYAEAEPLDQWALRSEPPSMAVNYNNLAGLYYKQGQYAQAELYLQRALELFVWDLGSEHLKVLENYIALLRKMNRDAEADKMEARAKAIRAKHAEENPPK